VILPWHLWQYSLHGHQFLHEYVGVNLPGRVFHTFEGHAGGPLDYLDILRHGFSIWGYLWPLAYIWTVWKALTRGDRSAWLLLSWITVPLVLFSTAQTKLGWYISMIYPAVGLLVGVALAELLTDRMALGAIAAVLVVCCLRLPMPVDGSRDVKQFAGQAVRAVTPADAIYVIQPACVPPPPPSTPDVPLIPVGNIRPSLRFYLEHPLICLEERHVQEDQFPVQAYIISEQDAWSRVNHLGRIVLEEQGFILAWSE
jgi:hypothetical protein